MPSPMVNAVLNFVDELERHTGQPPERIAVDAHVIALVRAGRVDRCERFDLAVLTTRPGYSAAAPEEVVAFGAALPGPMV